MSKKDTPKHLILLDAHAILHRAYHALPDFTSSTGEPTGALYGLCAMLLKIIKELSPDYLVACYDLPKPTHRHEAFDGYKAGRAKTDTDLTQQIERSRDVLEALNVPIYEAEGFEADDVLGTIVEQTKNKKDTHVIIASGDMDTLQLVNKKRVRVYTLKKGIKDTIIYDEQAVHERFGFGPELLPDYKGLRGDPSDNIPGIAGIGEKTATTLITTFGSIENLYKKLKKGTTAFEKAGIKERIINLLKEGEEEALFSKMLGEIRRDAPITFSFPQKTWHEGLDAEKALRLFQELGFRSLSARVRDMFAVADTPDTASTQEKEEVVDENDIRETALALWVLNSDTTNPTREDVLAFAHTKDFAQARKQIFSELKKQKLEGVYKEIELPLVPVVEKMQERGVLIDGAFLKKLSTDYHQELSRIEKKVFNLAGKEFNISSPKQLGEVLYDDMGLKPARVSRTAGGARSTRETELNKLAGEPIIDEILSYRELRKLLSTYIDTIPEMLDSKKRLHAQFLQTGTTTGRMSSNNPNLQNIPIRTELGRRIRNAFVAPTGYRLVAFDYSQIELRVSAFLSKDKKMIEIFKKGGDIHTAVAAEVFGVLPEDVSPEQRRRAKVINFGIHYGMGVNALAKAINASRTEAGAFLDEYFLTFSGLAAFIEHTKHEAGKKGYTQTHFGRRRYLPGLSSHLPYVRAEAERQALNAPIQGTQADIIKIAMKRIDDFLVEGKHTDTHLILQIHDELVYEVPEKKIQTIAPDIQAIMESVLTPKEMNGIPLVVDVSVGKNWGEMEKM